MPEVPGNLVSNWSLENFYVDDKGYTVANDWTAFVLSGSLSISNSSGELIHGETCQQFWSDWGTFDAGIYQRINGLSPGVWYKAYYATAAQWRQPYHDGSMVRTIGLDPHGGSNPESGNVIWGSSVASNGGWATHEIGNAPLVSAQAQSPSITLFVKVTTVHPNEQAQTWVDCVVLLQDSPQLQLDNKAFIPIALRGYSGGW